MQSRHDMLTGGREHPAGIGRGRWGTRLKPSKESLGAGVLLAGAWTVDVETPAVAPRGGGMQPAPTAAEEKPRHALALVHPFLPHDRSQGKEFTPFPRYGWALE